MTPAAITKLLLTQGIDPIACLEYGQRGQTVPFIEENVHRLDTSLLTNRLSLSPLAGTHS